MFVKITQSLEDEAGRAQDGTIACLKVAKLDRKVMRPMCLEQMSAAVFVAV